MKKSVIIIGAIIGLFIVGQGVAQTTEEVCKEKIQSLDFMIGSWSGGGWMMTPEAGRVQFTQKEQIKTKLNGAILHISGQGWDLDGDLVHNALAVVSFIPRDGEFAMHSFLEDGKQAKAQFELIEDRKIKWWFSPTEISTVEYIIEIKDDTWTEKGRYSPDGQQWFPFIEFTLTKD